MPSRIYFPFFILALVALCSIAIGCGGGVSGTGGQRFEGTLTGEDQKGLAQVVVTLVETGEVTTTNGEGLFVFETESILDRATFRFKSSTIDGKNAVVDSIPNTAEVVKIKFSYQDPNSEVQVDEVSYL